MRILLYSGKGGVGKTTVAAATGVHLAKQGYKTLVLSTDPSHSLSDSFQTELTSSPTRIDTNLWGEEVDVIDMLVENWQTIQDYIASVMKASMAEDLVAEEAAILPGMDELMGLWEIYRLNERDEYDCLIVDSAPTGQVLRLLSLPEVARWWIQKIFPIERKIAKAFRTVKKDRIMDIPIPDDQVYTSVQEFFNNVGELRNLLIDREQTSIRIVVNPERMVIEESQRAFTYLNLYEYPVDCIVANRLIPDSVDDAYFRDWKTAQKGYLEKIQESFAPLPILKAELMSGEVVGQERLEEMASLLYKDSDPFSVYYQDYPQRIVQENGYYVLTLQLPFAHRDDVQLHEKGDQLIVRIGNLKREIFLPRVLAMAELSHAKFENHQLRIYFEKGGSHDGET